ncbi:MAG: hypothetical protein H0U53_09680, partial [Actinobacteria bacterium]|nr:hypothetical protein [Actinomycetota bacterium]
MPLRIKGKKELVAAYVLRELPEGMVSNIESLSWQAELQRVARRLGEATFSGLVSGAVVGGIGGRLAMLVLRLTSDSSVHGIKTDDGFIIGRFRDTLFLILFTAVLGALSALFYLVIRLWFPERWRPLLMACLGATIGGAFFITPGGVDFTLLDPLLLAVALFIALPGLHGFTMSVIIENLLSYTDRPRFPLLSWFSLLPLAGFLFLNPVGWLIFLILGLGWTLKRRFGLLGLWTSSPMVWA